MRNPLAFSTLAAHLQLLIQPLAWHQEKNIHGHSILASTAAHKDNRAKARNKKPWGLHTAPACYDLLAAFCMGLPSDPTAMNSCG